MALALVLMVLALLTSLDKSESRTIFGKQTVVIPVITIWRWKSRIPEAYWSTIPKWNAEYIIYFYEEKDINHAGNSIKLRNYMA